MDVASDSMYISKHLPQFSVIILQLQLNNLLLHHPKLATHRNDTKIHTSSPSFLLLEPTIISTQQTTNHQQSPEHGPQCHNHLATPLLQHSTRSKA
jgi:hypothetical protein